MKKTTFYPTIWQAMAHPYSVLNTVDGDGKPVKELILHAEIVKELKISEMQLNIEKLTIFNDKEQEELIHIPRKKTILPAKGMAEGYFLKSKGFFKLKPGNYKTLRFYLNAKQNMFTYCDGVEETLDGFKYLDFKIENQLQLSGGESPEVKLWFDFAPYKFSRHFKFITNLFNFKNRNQQKPAFG
ncbi:hypothetical protein MTsPCn9_24830 [Croceitalea sp. MTPC9]|uniref:hypothetical protein n=1 Tax=unclassified Croceitalea TaxID=2632280 RepID=UPI002B3B5B58|nr:hypothetical protein MTsPCn6_29700 [Croceitalea sp. MTPC6]GMN17545.1 hypothetical protein MTsPCn9_24830 [Croceitalea sp. MTPC9]